MKGSLDPLLFVCLLEGGEKTQIVTQKTWQTTHRIQSYL